MPRLSSRFCRSLPNRKARPLPNWSQEFKSRWRIVGRKVSPFLFDNYLPELEKLGIDDKRLLVLLRCELNIRIKSGQAPDASEYENRFPHLMFRIRTLVSELTERPEVHKPAVNGSEFDTPNNWAPRMSRRRFPTSPVTKFRK